MSKSEERFTSPASLLLDAILVIAFFVFMYTLVSKHVPSENPTQILVWGALCSSCITAVFWLCIQMFRVVLGAQNRLKAERVRR